MKKLVVSIFFFMLLSAAYSSWAQQDSLQSVLQTPLLDSLSQLSARQWRADSLNVLSWSDSLKLKITRKFNTDSIRYQEKVDSLRNLKLPVDEYTQKLDSIAGKRDLLFKEVQEKQEQVLAKTKGSITEWQNKARAKLGGNLSVPDGIKVSDVPGVDFPSVPGVEVPKAQLSGLELPEMPALSDVDLQGVDLSPDLTKLNESISMDALDGLKEAQETLGKAGETLSEVTSLTKDTDKLVDASVGQLSEVEAIEEQVNLAEGVKSNTFMEKADQLKDPAALQQEAKEQVVQKAVDHFAGKEEVLKQAMEKMAKYKQKYESLNSLSDIKKRPPNPMKKKPFIERLVPGVALQIQQKHDLLVDVNPYLGYRLSGRLTSGMGWNQRIGYNTDNHYFTSAAVLYGPRVFTEFKVWKGFSARAEAEVMNTFVPPLLRAPSVDNGHREWVWSVMLGLKKEYRFLKHVRGTAFIMFNLFDPHHKSPYGDVLNTRFGFEFPLKKKKKKAG